MTITKKRKHGQGALYPLPDGGWRMQVRVDGKRHSFNISKRSRKEAEKAARDMRTELFRQAEERHAARERGENPNARDVTFDDLLTLIQDDYKAKGNRSRLKVTHLTQAFAGMRAIDITPLAIREYRRKRSASGAAAATINNEMSALRRMFSLAVESRLLTSSQAPVIRLPDPKNARQGFFERDDFEAVVAELPEHLRPVMEFAYHTGWRVQSEVLTLTWAQVDFAAGIVRLEPNTTKNDEGRTYPFASLAHLQRLMERQRLHTRETELRTGSRIPYVFHRDGAPIRTYQKAWTIACDRAAHGGQKRPTEGPDVRELTRPSVVGRLVHDLRRTNVRNLERAGVARSVATKLTGHKTEAVYRRYAIAAEADLREGVAKLAALMIIEAKASRIA